MVPTVLNIKTLFLFMFWTYHVMSSPVTALSLFQGVCCWSQRQRTPWTSRQFITGPSLMATAHQEQFGSVSCSRILWHAAQLRFEPATFQSLADPLYPLSYSYIHFLPHIFKIKWTNQATYCTVCPTSLLQVVGLWASWEEDWRQCLGLKKEPLFSMFLDEKKWFHFDLQLKF